MPNNKPTVLNVSDMMNHEPSLSELMDNVRRLSNTKDVYSLIDSLFELNNYVSKDSKEKFIVASHREFIQLLLQKIRMINNAELISEILDFLGYIADHHQENPNQILQIGFLKIIPNMLQRTSELTQKSIAWSIGQMVKGNPTNQQLLNTKEIINGLAKLIRSTDHGIVSAALLAIFWLVNKNAINQDAVMANNHIPKRLLKLLKPAESDVRGSAASVITSIVEGNPKHQKWFVKQKVQKAQTVMEIFIQWLTEENDKIKRAATWAIARLSERNAKNQSLAIESGVVPHIVAMLDHANMLTKSAAAWAVAALCGNEQKQKTLQEAGVMPGLIACIASDDSAVSSYAAYAVHLMVYNNFDNQQAYAAANIAPALLKSLKRLSNIQGIKNSLLVIQSLVGKSERVAVNEENQTIFGEINLLIKIFQLMFHANDDIKRAAEATIKALVCDHEANEQQVSQMRLVYIALNNIGVSSGLPDYALTLSEYLDKLNYIIQFLNVEDATIKSSRQKIVCALTVTHKLGPLLKNLSFKSDIKALVLMIRYLVEGNVGVQNLIHLKSTVIDSLVPLLDHEDVMIQCEAIQAIAAITDHHAENQQKAGDLGVIPQLLTLLNETNIHLDQDGINVIADYHPTSELSARELSVVPQTMTQLNEANIHLQNVAIYAIATLTKNNLANVKVLFNESHVVVLFKLMRSDQHVSTQNNAKHALAQMVTELVDQHSMHLLRKVIIQLNQLPRLLNDATFQENMAWVLSVVATDSSVKVKMTSYPIVMRLLVSLFDSDNSNTRYYAQHTLIELAHDNAINQYVIAAAFPIRELVKNLYDRCQNSEEINQTLSLISRLTLDNPRNQKYLLNVDTLYILASCLTAHDASKKQSMLMRHKTLIILGYLIKHNHAYAVQPLMRQIDVVDKVFACLDDADRKVIIYATTLIGTLAKDPMNYVAIINHPGMETIMGYQKSSDVEIKDRAKFIISKLTVHCGSRSHVDAAKLSLARFNSILFERGHSTPFPLGYDVSMQPRKICGPGGGS